MVWAWFPRRKRPGPRRILWTNDAFGAGKTTTAQLMRTRHPGSVLIDPEEVGSMLRPFLRPVAPVCDFQKWSAWRESSPGGLLQWSESYPGTVRAWRSFRRPSRMKITGPRSPPRSTAQSWRRRRLAEFRSAEWIPARPSPE